MRQPQNEGTSARAGNLPTRMGAHDPRQYSRIIAEGSDKTANRAMLRAMGLGDIDMRQPWIGVASVWSEATPCNVNLDVQAERIAEHLKGKGTTPRRFNTISVSDGIGMGHEGMMVPP
jgi:dihydroxy-acid dehydratase